MNFNYAQLKVTQDVTVNLKDYSTDESGGYDKKTAKDVIKSNIRSLKIFNVFSMPMIDSLYS